MAGMPTSTRITKVFICHPYHDDFDAGPAYRAYRRFLTEINGLTVSVPLLEGWSPPLRIGVRHQNYQDVLYLSRHALMPVRAYEDFFYLTVAANWPISCTEDRRIERALAVQQMTEVATKLMVALSIYYPASTRAQFAYTAAHPDDGLNFTCISSLEDCANFLLRGELPLRPALSPIQWLEWTFAREGFWRGKARTNLDQALALATHLHHHQLSIDGIDDFVWCMAAIEALFTDSAQSVGDQLRRRIGVLLPELAEAVSKKAIGRLYGYRSRLVHGDIKVGNRFGHDWNDDAHDREYGDNFELASTILIKALHKAAEQGLNQIKFADVLIP